MESRPNPAVVKPARLKWSDREAYRGIRCPYCGSNTRVIDSGIVYGQGFGWLVACTRYPQCDAFVGCHPRSMRPLGSVADAATRAARVKAHKVFDVAWRGKKGQRHPAGARTKAYAWLSKELGVDPELCHIGYFDLEMCGRVVQACEQMNGGRR